ncbi:hypothetical protein V6N11_058763 [Hibiscus sabdariffa]|uniref:Uncharacterized protein n=1 Tax=Hibiscus sabdariffa TaxID=183260 RepID=A0ABR2U623_9ROSI
MSLAHSHPSLHHPAIWLITREKQGGAVEVSCTLSKATLQSVSTANLNFLNYFDPQNISILYFIALISANMGGAAPSRKENSTSHSRSLFLNRPPTPPALTSFIMAPSTLNFSQPKKKWKCRGVPTEISMLFFALKKS